MRVVRMVCHADIDDLVDLAAQSSGLMTTMPRDRAAMEERVNDALAFNDTYLMVLEEDGKLVGMCALYADIGRIRPFYNYKITNLTKLSPEVGVRVDTRVLHPVNDFDGATELGTLFLHPDYRGDGRGRLLSWARFMFMATHRGRFGDVVMAELRGWTDENGRSPVWDAIGNRFFTLDLDEADILSGREYRFIADLLPNYPIYIDLLDGAAQSKIGVPHDGSAPAGALLAKQGLRSHGYVDIFDGGPCIDSHIDDVDMVRRSVVATARAADPLDGPATTFVSNTGLDDFAVGVCRAIHGDDGLLVPASVLASLGRSDGDPVRFYDESRA